MANTSIRKCLIVEDHDMLRNSLKAWLAKSFPEVEFLEANTGEDGVRQARQYKPAVVMMDVSLPGISGIQATRHIKEFAPDIHVVMLTIIDDDNYRNDAMAAGASAYVIKRDAQMDLLAVLGKYLAGSANAKPDGN